MESLDADGNITSVEDPSQDMKSIAFELHVGDEQIVTFESETKILDTQNVPDATKIVEIFPNNSASIVQFQADPGTGKLHGKLTSKLTAYTGPGAAHLQSKKKALQAAAPVKEMTMLPDKFCGTIQVGTKIVTVFPNEKQKKVEMQTRKKAKLDMRQQRLASEIVPKTNFTKPVSTGVASAIVPETRPVSTGVASAIVPKTKPVFTGVASAIVPETRPVSTGIWFETQEEMTQYLEEFQDKTLTKYCISYVKHNWNQGNFEVSDYPNIKQVHWKTSVNSLIPFDRYPYIILTAKVLMCHQGKSYTRWENNKINKELRAKFGQIREKTRNYTIKKVGCPAKIDIKKILKFTSWKLDRNTKRGKHAIYRKLKDYLTSGRVPETKVYYVISKPSVEDHRGHPLNGEVKIYLPVHPVLKRAIVQLMINAHVRSAAEMMKLLGAFRTSHFADKEEQPLETDSRWYPHIRTLNNIMAATKQRLANGRMDPVTGEWHRMPPHKQGRFSKKASAPEALATMTSTLDLGEVTEVTTSGGIAVEDEADLQDVVHAERGRFPEAVATAQDLDHTNLAGLTETEMAARHLISIQSGVLRVPEDPEAVQMARAPGSGRLLPASSSAAFKVSGVTRVRKKAPVASTLGVKIRALAEKMVRFSETCADVGVLQRAHANCQRIVRDLKAGTPRDLLQTLEPPTKKRKVKREELQQPFHHQHHLQRHQQPQQQQQRQEEFDVYHYPQALSGL